MSVYLNLSNIVDSEVDKLLSYTNSYLNVLTQTKRCIIIIDDLYYAVVTII